MAVTNWSVFKRNKRLQIEDRETGEVIYTPPNFVTLIGNRSALHRLADAMAALGRRDIGLIAEFEAVNRRGVSRPFRLAHR